MVDYKGYETYVAKNFDWEVLSGNDNQNLYEGLWFYDSKLGQVDTAYYKFEKKYGERDPNAYGDLGKTLDIRKRFLNTIHYEYGRILYHQQFPYEDMEKIDLISEEKLLADCQFAEIMDDFNSERNAHQDVPGEDTEFMQERFELFQIETAVHARAFLCAGYMEEKRRTELLTQYAS